MPTMPNRPSSGAVAPQHGASTSPAKPEVAGAPHDTEPVSVSARRPQGPSARRPRIVVKGTAPSETTPAPGVGPAPLEYPVQLSKVQAPPLREDTLARDRLLDWLSVKIHSRVVLLVAEAGYGKTTLLADFSRRTRIRALWFRLDRGDRDWMGFIAHLIAAVRVHMPAFGSATAGMLRNASTAAISLDAVLDIFLRELASLPNDPTALVFDDVHLVDDSPDVKQILGELLARGPERMSFVFASRREPPVRLARLRALGEVAELRTDDLRFDAGETERLFRETYELPLDQAVLGELNRRTEGWAASLQLVRAAIHGRNPAQVRSFISSLSGAEGHLYEYLAEEVVGDLPAHLQEFLMRTSVLDAVDLTLGPIAAGISHEETRLSMDEAERRGLLGRSGSSGRNVFRSHPLVRDFLRARLRRSVGTRGVRSIHLAVAEAARVIDWRASARHFIGAGAHDEAKEVITAATGTILATGGYSAAEELIAKLDPSGLPGLSGLVIRSRIAQRRASVEEALALAERAWESDRTSSLALMNLMAVRTVAGDIAGALEAGRLLAKSGSPHDAALGRAYQAALETSCSGSIDVALAQVESLVQTQRDLGVDHYLGVSLLNLALLRLATAEFDRALANAEEATALLSGSSAGMELVSARLARAEALEFIGSFEEGRSEIDAVISAAADGQLLEVVADVGRIEGFVGESRRVWPILERIDSVVSPDTDLGEQVLYARALTRIQDGDVRGAASDAGDLQHGRPSSTVAFEARRLLLEGLLLLLEGQDADAKVQAGTNLARAQGAKLLVMYGMALGALADAKRNPSHALAGAAQDHPVVLSMLAEAVVLRLGDLDTSAAELVFSEAERRPWRWRPALRSALRRTSGPATEAAATLLEAIGEREDVALLDRVDRTRDRRGPRLGHRLSRRLAERVFIEDLGRVRVIAGSRTIEGAEVRRKVLALLCLLLTRPRFASTRDEVIDSLWPDHDPASALNSLNQTVYFLRRVFEPTYADEVSPGYVGQDGETIWLDQELISCRSRHCLELIESMPGVPTPEGSLALAKAYRGRFALDFMYEEWAAGYRDGLHAAYLRVMENSIRLDLDSGHLHRGTFIAEQASAVDPEAEGIQVALIRLYQHSGAHAAAAEQYRHYARGMTDLGLEPTALADL